MKTVRHEHEKIDGKHKTMTPLGKKGEGITIPIEATSQKDSRIDARNDKNAHRRQWHTKIKFNHIKQKWTLEYPKKQKTRKRRENILPQ